MSNLCLPGYSYNHDSSDAAVCSSDCQCGTCFDSYAYEPSPEQSLLIRNWPDPRSSHAHGGTENFGTCDTETYRDHSTFTTIGA